MEPPEFTVRDFPGEITQEFLLNIPDLQDVINFCRSYQEAFQICQNETFWKEKYFRDFLQPLNIQDYPQLKSGEKWSALYRQIYLLGDIGVPISLSKTNIFGGIIDNQGKLYMVGSNSYGQLGNGTLINGTKLINISKLSKDAKLDFGNKRIIAVSCGKTHAAAITDQGELYSWGTAGLSGALAGRDKSYTPFKVNLPNRFSVTKVSCGNSHTAVITTDGSVYRWGSAGDVVNQPDRVNLPEDIKAVDLSAGPKRVCLVGNDGQVYRWGIVYKERTIGLRKNNQRYGGVEYPEKIKIPIEEGEIPPVKIISVSCGNQFTLALSESGHLFVWGDNTLGQLGLGNKVSREEPIQNPFLENIRQISAGSIYSGAVTQEGKIFMWGSNAYERISGNASEAYIDQPMELLIGENVKSIFLSCGIMFSMVLIENGQINTWGLPIISNQS